MTRTSIRRWLQRFLWPRLATRRPTLPVRLALEVLEDRRTPALLTVNTTADAVNPTDGTLSLRDAIAADNAGNANALTAGEKSQVSGTFGVNDTIEFSSALNGATITLNGTALPEFLKSMTITGLGAGNLAINGNHQSGIFIIPGNTTVITGLTIENGNAGGAGIYNQGMLTVSGCTFADNSASIAEGGGILNNNGTLTVNNSTFLDNSANTQGIGSGGGIANSFGTLTVTNSTFSGNSAYIRGGGINNNGGTLTVSNSTFSDDSVFLQGGGIYNTVGSTLTVSNSTFSDDSAYIGGGITNTGKMTVTNSTLAGNLAQNPGGGNGAGGGIAIGSGGQATLNNTIVANSTGGGDLSIDSGQGSAYSGSFDLIGDGSDFSSFTHSLQGNPQLASLGNYGGPTQTMLLLPASPAIDAGSNALAVDANGKPLTTDQRGDPRIVGAAVDIGAVESQGFMLPNSPAVDELGAYRASDGSWSLDSDSTPGFNSATDQVFFSFSPPGVIGVAGDWTGSGTSKIGDFSNGTWHLDLNDNGVLDPGETFTFGQAGDQPVVGDWTGNGVTNIGVFRAAPDGVTGEFILDTNGDHQFDAGDEVFTFGLATDRIVVGDWNGDGKTKVGVFRDAVSYNPADAGDALFSLDTNGDHQFDAGDQVFIFGLITDHLIVGDWNGAGKSEVGVYRDGSTAPVGNPLYAPGTALFSLDTNGDLQFDSGDQVFLYGLTTDQFVSGHWAKTPPLQPEGTPPAQFAANGIGPGGAAALTQAQLAPVVQQAIAYWTAQGADPAQLEAVPASIGQLDGNLVGWTDANGITISSDAAGWGWYTSLAPNVPANQMDLLTVVEHEFGHEVGLSDVDPGTHPGNIMDSTLPTGVRRF